MPRLTLELLPPHPQAGSWTFASYPVRIGSDPEGDLVMADRASASVAVEHARILESGGKLLIQNRGSASGTIVNGQQVERKTLKDGDGIILGPARAQLVVRLDLLESVSDETIKTILPRADSHTIRLIVRTARSDRPPLDREFDQPVITLGRDVQNDIDFSDPPHPVVSRRHAEIVWSGQGYQLTDRQATNGTLVNGRHVHSVTLHHGDVIELGNGGPEIEVSLPEDVRDAYREHRRGGWVPWAVAAALVLLGALGWSEFRGGEGHEKDAPIVLPATEEQFIAEEVRQFARAMNNDIDVVPGGMVRKIQRHIDVLSGEDRREFVSRLRTARALMPVVEQILVENGLPAQLAYIAFQESRFDPHARSHAGAVGLWQFMAATAREYGLKVSRDHDERLDPVKSTRAAARYLKKLYLLYGDFMIALAAYNFGPRNVNAALIQIIEDDPLRNRNYWYLVEKDLLPRETDEYVHKIMAGWIVATHPERFGFPPELAIGGSREAPPGS